MTSKHPLVFAAVFGLGFALAGCGGEEAPVAAQRGMGGQGVKVDTAKAPAGGAKAPAGGGSRRSQGSEPAAEGEGEPEPVRPDRPKTLVSREDFAIGSRDPFHTYLSPALANETAPVEVLDKQRNVKLPEYDFEELKLIAIVNAGRNVEPRALFLAASDKKSKSVRQGEYFSRAEVLLASVNRDYIEIEIIDPELTPGWNMERGERRVIYLKEPKG